MRPSSLFTPKNIGLPLALQYIISIILNFGHKEQSEQQAVFNFHGADLPFTTNKKSMNETIEMTDTSNETQTTNQESIQHFLGKLKEKMKQVYHQRGDNNKYSQQRGLPPFVLREIMECNPLSIGIPKAYGGRGALMHENIALLEAASYESLALSLTFGINSALFLQPVGKYGQEEAKQQVFKRFLQHKNMGGLMITEPDYGSDALNMQTSFTEEEEHFWVKGKSTGQDSPDGLISGC